MNHVWWRTHLRKLPELGFLAQFGSFNEVDDYLPFLTDTLALPQQGRVLELDCGRGSFAIRLAQWGYRVTALDESGPMLAVAREGAAVRGVEVEFRQSDPLALPDRGVFDGALLLDFGTRADPDNAAILRAVAAALRPGGRVVLSTCNPYYWAREARTEHRLQDGTDIIRRYDFQFREGSLRSRVRLIRPDGERVNLPEARYRAYTLPELSALAAATGLADLKVFGEDESGAPRADLPLNSLETPFFHCVALRPVTGETGEGI